MWLSKKISNVKSAHAAALESEKQTGTSTPSCGAACSLSSSSGWEVDLGVLDSGIREKVGILVRAGVETFESCQGGVGHCFTEPTIRFHGGSAEGFRALAVAMDNGLKVISLRRYWSINGNEPTGTHWEMTFLPDEAP